MPPRKPSAKTVDEDFIDDSDDNNNPSGKSTKKQKRDPKEVDGKRERVASSKQGKIGTLCKHQTHRNTTQADHDILISPR
jgi:hypothetical protein